MTDQQLLEYEALAGVAVDADADELECAWAIDALVAEVRRLRSEGQRSEEEKERLARDWRYAYGRLQARETQLEREVGRLRERVDYLEGWQKGAEEGALHARSDVEWWQKCAREWEEEWLRFRQSLQELRELNWEQKTDIERASYLTAKAALKNGK